jgi:hypothetical protein
MPKSKAKPTPVARGTTKPNVASRQRLDRQTAATAGDSTDSRRLLREAAWSQMFGRVEAKNPFGGTA